MIDLVLVRLENGQNYVFIAPYCSSLREGDRVKCETKHGDTIGVVVACVCVSDENSDDYKFIIHMTGVKLPLKRVVAKIYENKLDYGDD